MRNRKIISILGIMGIVLILTGVTYSFFNYTREGAANNLGTGTISFLSTQNNTLNLTNLKPMKSENIDSSTLDAVTITVQGATSYDDGEEYLISIASVNNTINNKRIPIKYIAEVSNTGSIGTSNSNYWNARENTNSSIYSLNSTGEVTDGAQVLVGYIKGGNNGINGSITIKAYIDGDRIAISDTLEEDEISGYENETDSEWVAGRTVFTTSEWNSLQSTPISFKIRAESNEGIWVKYYTPGYCFDTEEAVEYIANSNMNVSTCANLFTNYWGPEQPNNDETYSSFCQGVGTYYGESFQEYLDFDSFGPEFLSSLEENNIIINVSDSNNISVIGYIQSSPYMTATVNSEMTQTEVNACVNFLTYYWGEEEEDITVLENETYEAFCQGTGTIYEMTFQETLDDNNFGHEALEYFEEHGIIELNIIGDGCHLDNISIPPEINGKNVIKIENYQDDLLHSFSDLTSVIIPDSVKIIGARTFRDNRLTSVTIPNSVTAIGHEAFYGNQLTSVTIPNSVTIIKDGAFRNNQLTSVIIPNSLTSIGDYAFAGNQLTSVIIPNSVITIGNAVFDDNLLTSVTIPNSVTVIGDYAFAGNQLTSVTIPNSVTTIGGAAFFKNQLTSITIPNSVIEIGEATFSQNQLTSITIPNSVTTIGIRAFAYNGLTSITIPNSVTTIETNAFLNNQLTSVTIGSGIISIGRSVFSKSNTTNTIGDITYYNNPNLTSITINKSCADIKNDLKVGNTNYYPWLSYYSPYRATGVTIYGANNEVCDSW